MAMAILASPSDQIMSVRYGKKDRKCAEISKWMATNVEPCDNTMADLETFSLEELPQNSFLVIRVDVAGPMEKYAAANELSKAIQKYQKIFLERNVSILVMTPKENLEVLTEAEMNQAGWFRKT